MAKKANKSSPRNKNQSSSKPICKKLSISDSKTDILSDNSHQESPLSQHEFPIAMQVAEEKTVEMRSYWEYEVRPQVCLFERLLA